MCVSEGALEELERIVARIRERWPGVGITVRGGSGFCRDGLTKWCEDNGILYVLGLAGNPRLKRRIGHQMRKSRARCVKRRKASRRFVGFRYRTLHSWSSSRRVMAKAEWLPGPRGYNARFVVTNIPGRELAGRELYEDLYSARGEMENGIKERQTDLFADRTSAHLMRANQLRAYFPAFAGVLIQSIRQFGLKATGMEQAQAGTIRTRLLKIAGAVRVTTRKIRVSLSSLYPWRPLFHNVVGNLATASRQLRAAPT